jgi:hypothetical protein
MAVFEQAKVQSLLEVEEDWNIAFTFRMVTKLPSDLDIFWLFTLTKPLCIQ